VRRECSDCGPCGGQIIASGTVEEVAAVEQSATGSFLKKMLSPSYE